MTEVTLVIRASNILRVGFALAVWCGAALAADPLPPEKIGVAVPSPPTPHRLYLTDLQIAHITDGVVHIVDGQSFKYLGMFSTGLFGITALTSDSSEMLVASTYYTKRNRGDRFAIRNPLKQFVKDFKAIFPWREWNAERLRRAQRFAHAA